MKKSYDTNKIISILKEREEGATVAELTRKYGISKSSFHKWKIKYGGMDVNDATKLKSLEQENPLKMLILKALMVNLGRNV